MSIFSVFGSIGKTIGKAALGAAGSVVGVEGLSNIFDKKTSGNVMPVTAAASLNVGTRPIDSQNLAGGSLLGSFKGFLDSTSDFLSGRTHAQIDANVGAGGRVDPKTGLPIPSGSLPAWVWPVGIGAALLLLLTSGGGSRKRY